MYAKTRPYWFYYLQCLWPWINLLFRDSNLQYISRTCSFFTFMDSLTLELIPHSTGEDSTKGKPCICRGFSRWCCPVRFPTRSYSSFWSGTEGCDILWFLRLLQLFRGKHCSLGTMLFMPRPERSTGGI